MRRLPALFAALIAGIVPVQAGEALKLQRGIGIHEWLNWAPLDTSGAHYQKPLYRTVDEWRARYRDLSEWPTGNEFARIKSMGFDFVRLTIDPGPLLDNGGADRAEGLAVLEAAVRQVTDQGLKVVFDYHLVPQIEAFGQDAMEGPVDAAQLVDFRSLLAETAAMLSGIGTDKVALEPMNEPQYYPCDGWAGQEWREVMASFVTAIRAVSTDLTIVATGACGGGTYGLMQMDPAMFDDPAILYSFHSYDPLTFTHQGTGDKLHLSGLPWPASERPKNDVVTKSELALIDSGVSNNDAIVMVSSLDGIIDDYYRENDGEAQLEKIFADAVEWASRYGIADRLFVGEFGVTRFSADRGGADDDDRYRYLEAVRSLAEKYDMAWSMWEYSNPHGMSLINPAGEAVPGVGVLRALGLQVSSAQ